ncbi:MAG: hypothetical protein KIT65_11005 [Xanthobacteraceae bacterium]|nr:hypothetical protein [Xanthobacteraceae bacterium]
MARAGYCGQVQDDEGNIVPLADIEVRRLVPGLPLPQLHAARTGSTTKSNSFPAEADGSFVFYVEPGGAFQIKASAIIGGQAWEKIIPYVAIATGAENDIQASQEPGYSFTFSDETAAPPDEGTIRANNADLSAATEIYVSITDIGGSDVTDRLIELDPGTKEVKSTFVLKMLATASTASWLVDAAELVGSTHVKLTVSDHNGVTELSGGVFMFREVAGGNGIPIAYLDTDGTLAANSDEKVPTQKAVRTYTAAEIATAINALIDAAPGALDTLKELATSLGDDPNFATTMTNALAGKQPLHALLTAISALTSVAAGDLIYASGTNTFSKTTLTAFIRGLLDDADAATARSTLVAAGTGVANTFSEEQSFEKFIDMPEISAPAAPSANRLRVYAKDVGGVTKLFIKDSDATETELGSGGGGSTDLSAVWRNIAKIMMKMADLANNVINWIGAISDSFDTTTGLNTGGSTNMSTAEAGVIKPTTTTATNQLPTMTSATTSGVTISASSEYSGYPGWKAADRIADFANSWASNGVQVATWEVDFGTSKILTGYSIKGDNSYLNRLPKDWTFQGWNGSTWVTLDTRTNETGWSATKRSYSFSNSTGYNKYRLNITAGNGGDGYLTIQEIELFDPTTTNNMTAISAAFDLPAEPDLIDAFFIIEKIDAMTPNTDYIFSVSIDGGSNYDAGTIDEIGTVGGLTVCQVIGIDVSARTGTSLRWKLETPNADACKLHEVMVRGY